MTLALFLVWFFSPIPLALGLEYLQGRWMLQDSALQWPFMLGAAAVWFIVGAGPYLWSVREGLEWRLVAMVLGWAALTGWYAGPIAMNVVNHRGHAERRPTEFHPVGHSKQLFSLAAGDAALDGVTFTCASTQWGARERGGRAPGRVARGRLGLWWGELEREEPPNHASPGERR